MEKCHWLWPNLVYEKTIDVPDIQAFNAGLIKQAIEMVKTGNGRLLSQDNPLPDDQILPEVRRLRDEVLASTNAWLTNAGLIDKYEPGGIDSYTGIYKPELFLSPHYHDPMVLITLYYLTDERTNNDHQVSAHLIPGQSRATKAGHTVFMDPRGNIQLRENPNIPGVFTPLEHPSILESCPRQGKMMTFAGHLLHWFMPTDSFRATITTGVDIRLRPGQLSDG
jgi:hypothetical protein